MANDFYTPSGNPATSSQGSSATMRAEFASIEDGFDKLPVMTGNAGKIVAVNSGGTALESIASIPVSKGGTGQTTFTDGQLLIGNSSGNTLAKSTLTAGSNIVITNGNGSITISATGSGGGGVGSVTSVAQTFTGGLISVSGSPITTSGTLALTVAGTSGGIPYFSSASTWASSAALTNNAIMLGGGAGGAPKTTTTGTGVVTALGINVGSAGSFVVNGGAGSFTTVTTTGVLTGPDGSASAPTYSFSSSGNSDNGMYLSAANTIGFASSGALAASIAHVPNNETIFKIIDTTSGISSKTGFEFTAGTSTGSIYLRNNSHFQNPGAFLINCSAEIFLQQSGTSKAVLNSSGEFITGGTTDQGAYNLQCNGTAVWGAGAYVNGSDARIKEDVAEIDSGLDVVAKLKPVKFRYKEFWSKDNSLQPGFIAQEIKQALDGKDYVDGVVQQGPEYMSVAYQTIIPILVKAIQEQQDMIKDLEFKVASLSDE